MNKDTEELIDQLETELLVCREVDREDFDPGERDARMNELYYLHLELLARQTELLARIEAKLDRPIYSVETGPCSPVINLPKESW